jgi:hypothetical protein
MIIDQAGSLQVCIHDSGAGEFEAAAFHVFAELI